VFVYGDGTVYRGEYAEGLRDGFGKCHWIDGEYHLGYWKSGLKEGVGIR
jgi:hypothetical protein